MRNEVLTQLATRSITPRKAYRELYPKPAKERKPKRAHFLKIRIRIPEEKGLSAFLAVFFWLPLPIFLAKMVIRKIKFEGKGDLPLEKDEIMKLLTARGLKVDVSAKDGVRVYIKTI